MATLDEITKEKQRLGEALARANAQREKLAHQLSELEAAERVLARYGKAKQPAKAASPRTPTTATKAAAPARGRGRRATMVAKPAGKPSSSNLSDRVLVLATGKTQEEITAACKGARPNHVGAAIAWHRRAGRMEGDAFKPRGDVDAVAEDVVALDQHVAEMDADAPFHSALVGNRGMEVRRQPLQCQGAFDGADHRTELDQYPVAGCLNDPPAVLSDERIGSGAVLAQCPRGARLVEPH